MAEYVSRLIITADTSEVVNGKVDVEELAEAAWLLADALDYLKEEHGVIIKMNSLEDYYD